MKDITNMDQLDLNKNDTLASKGFERMSLNKLLKDNEKQPSSSGLNSLLNPSKPKDSIEHNNNQTSVDNLMLSEIIRKLNLVEKKLESNKVIDSNKNYVLFNTALIGILIIVSLVSLMPKEPKVVYKTIPPKNPIQHIITDYVNLRSNPSIKSRKILVLSKGQDVTIVKKDKGWVQIEYKDKLSGVKHNGWVFGDYLVTKTK